MLDAVEGDYSNADVKQDGVYWYGVQIKRDSTGNSYTLSYMDSNTNSYNKDHSGFDINQANAPYEIKKLIRNGSHFLSAFFVHLYFPWE